MYINILVTHYTQVAIILYYNQFKKRFSHHTCCTIRPKDLLFTFLAHLKSNITILLVLLLDQNEVNAGTARVNPYYSYTMYHL